MKRVILAGLILNGILIGFLAIQLLRARTLLPLTGVRHVTELDRAGVFSEDNLRSYDPSLGQNLRYNLGRLFTREYHRAFMTVLVFTTIASTANIWLLILVWRRSCR